MLFGTGDNTTASEFCLEALNEHGSAFEFATSRQHRAISRLFPSPGALGPRSSFARCLYIQETLGKESDLDSFILLVVFVLVALFVFLFAILGMSLFAENDPFHFGKLHYAMLSLFRICTFEDWTDVMYETMAVYSFSWIFYLSFIFLTTFAFLNMVIGIVVNVLEEEQAKADTEDPDRSSLRNLHDEMIVVRASLERLERLLEASEQSTRDSRSGPEKV